MERSKKRRRQRVLRAPGAPRASKVVDVDAVGDAAVRPGGVRGGACLRSALDVSGIRRVATTSFAIGADIEAFDRVVG